MNKRTNSLTFLYFRKFWITDFGWPDISFGVHICMRGRVDIHFLKWMISVGTVPIYLWYDGRETAASNSFHDATMKRQKVRPNFRAGVAGTF